MEQFHSIQSREEKEKYELGRFFVLSGKLFLFFLILTFILLLVRFVFNWLWASLLAQGTGAMGFLAALVAFFFFTEMIKKARGQ